MHRFVIDGYRLKGIRNFYLFYVFPSAVSETTRLLQPRTSSSTKAHILRNPQNSLRRFERDTASSVTKNRYKDITCTAASTKVIVLAVLLDMPYMKLSYLIQLRKCRWRIRQTTDRFSQASRACKITKTITAQAITEHAHSKNECA